MRLTSLTHVPSGNRVRTTVLFPGSLVRTMPRRLCSGSGPQWRESRLPGRLSPHTNRWPAGTVSGDHCAMSPGRPTTRLTYSAAPAGWTNGPARGRLHARQRRCGRGATSGAGRAARPAHDLHSGASVPCSPPQRRQPIALSAATTRWQRPAGANTQHLTSDSLCSECLPPRSVARPAGHSAAGRTREGWGRFGGNLVELGDEVIHPLAEVLLPDHGVLEGLADGVAHLGVLRGIERWPTVA